MARKIIDRLEYITIQAALEKRLESTPTMSLLPDTHNVNLIPDGLNIGASPKFRGN